MSIEVVSIKELSGIMQNVNLIRVKFASDEMWAVVPVLYAADKTVEVVMDLSKGNNPAGIRDNSIFKFQRQGFEYLVSGRICEVSKSNPKTVTIKYELAQRVNNQRKYVRFDTNLKVIIRKGDGASIESLARNISMGGAMIVASEDIDAGSVVDIKIIFESGNHFGAKAKVLRKSPDKDNSYSYGVQFIEINQDNSELIHREISKYEKAYLKSLSILREYTRNDDACFDTKISILSYDRDESYDIREVLVKLGAENFDILHDFKYYAGYFLEEGPKIVIVDTEDAGDEVIGVLKNIEETFPQIYIILILPMEYLDSNEVREHIPERVSILYKPLIYSEFEKEIIKYL